MYYRFNHADLDKCGREKYEYYTMEQLKKNVPLTPFESYEDNWEDGTWFVYLGYSCMSCTPLDCKDVEEAYENLLEAENTSLYERWHDL